MGMLTRATILLGRSVLEAADAVLSTDVPPTPDNLARKCHLCPHDWHGVRCKSCPCSSAWVEP